MHDSIGQTPKPQYARHASPSATTIILDGPAVRRVEVDPGVVDDPDRQGLVLARRVLEAIKQHSLAGDMG